MLQKVKIDAPSPSYAQIYLSPRRLPSPLVLLPELSLRSLTPAIGRLPVIGRPVGAGAVGELGG